MDIELYFIWEFIISEKTYCVYTLHTRIFVYAAQFAILIYFKYIPVASFSRHLAKNSIAMSILQLFLILKIL